MEKSVRVKVLSICIWNKCNSKQILIACLHDLGRWNPQLKQYSPISPYKTRTVDFGWDLKYACVYAVGSEISPNCCKSFTLLYTLLSRAAFQKVMMLWPWWLLMSVPKARGTWSQCLAEQIFTCTNVSYNKLRTPITPSLPPAYFIPSAGSITRANPAPKWGHIWFLRKQMPAPQSLTPTCSMKVTSPISVKDMHCRSSVGVHQTWAWLTHLRAHEQGRRWVCWLTWGHWSVMVGELPGTVAGPGAVHKDCHT